MATTTGTTKAKTTTAKKPAAAAKPAATVKKTTASKPAQNAAFVGKETLEKIMSSTTETLTQNFEKVFGATRERLESAMNGFGDVSSYGRENVDAVVASSTVVAKGVEAVSAEIAAISKRNLEDGVAAVKALTAVKSAKEYFEIQQDLMRSAWDKAVSDGTKINELFTAYSKDAVAPINGRITAAMENFGKPATL